MVMTTDAIAAVLYSLCLMQNTHPLNVRENVYNSR